jgi:predicted NBD/HSP70 family sugar kinase
LTGLSRSTVAQRVDELLDRNLVIIEGDLASTGGRPPGALRFNKGCGYVLAIDCGASRVHLGIADLGGDVAVEYTDRLNIAEGPEIVLDWVETTLRGMINSSELSADQIFGVGIGLPGPVEHSSGRPINPPIMPGWDGYPVSQRLTNEFGVPTLVDNDVNIMAIGEHRSFHVDADNFLFIKVSTGIGCGIVLDGRIHRGAHGAAGDIGHVYVPGHDEVICACGNVGCLEAVASGPAIAAHLDGINPKLDLVDQVVEQVLGGKPDAVSKLREAGRELGGVLAMLVNAYDPDTVVIGGQLSEADQPLIAGAREVVYRRSLPLATHNLRIERSRLGDRAGVVGAAIMVVDHVLSNVGVDEI